MLGRKMPTDPELIEMIRAGKQKALLHLYEQCFPSIRHYVIKNNGRFDDVEDVIQEALVIVWQKIIAHQYHDSAKLSTFTYAIGKNIWMNRLRKTTRIQSMDGIQEPWEDAGLAQKMDLALVKKCMEELGETCKKLLGYFYFDGFDMSECAVLLEFNNANTAKAKKYQCLKKLEEVVRSRYRKEDFFK